ncbi:MAG TPA: hypothetical protein DIT22_02895 [Thermodesulfobacterium commune]|uniref:DUF294 domain-containing protein n=1 Tax=Thermodesulfobacterium commune TaxID=1741 RepID=A0A3B8N5L9_9BACT|nr:hypothetical protein [Thermodesulfobacterium commune]HBT03328.1 hypothetical protein [Thermodesulfobacterium commune]HCE80350.1 hypothetical protein [Thermodesulfobacterium commune]HCP09637.1 hypothetical protein [Thermodesulfobacterium commune]
MKRRIQVYPFSSIFASSQKTPNRPPPDNYLNPQELSKKDRDQLKQIFKTIKTFQEFLFRKYNLRFFT